jgi:uncharacterized RDD family membrane protein YckC
MRYGTFWQRVAATLIDALVLLPLWVAVEWISGSSTAVAMSLLLPAALLYIGYYTYLHARFGQTVGKRVMGIQVVRLDGNAIGWREAWLRSAVAAVILMIQVAASWVALSRVGEEAYEGLGWQQRITLLSQHEPAWSSWIEGVSLAWSWVAVVVMLFHRERRSLHDFIAGTVVVQEPRVEETSAVAA